MRADTNTKEAAIRRLRGVIEVCDEDYRSVWRPCPALEEPGGENAEEGESRPTSQEQRGAITPQV